MEYIEREAAIQAASIWNGDESTEEWVKNALRKLPAADVIERKREWIPVTERLPEEYTRAIGYMAWKAMTAIEYQNGRWYLVDHLAPLPDKAVTHWMPLPKPPEEES